MLLELSITDFAIIDQLRVRLDEHLNVFTGETGAGKSILVDAVSALIGARVGADRLRWQRTARLRSTTAGTRSIRNPPVSRTSCMSWGWKRRTVC